MLTLFDFLKENFYSDLRHSIEVDDVLGHYDIEMADIHEPLDGFNVFAKGMIRQSYNMYVPASLLPVVSFKSKPFAVINRMPTSFDKGIMYKKFYIEAENTGDLELKKSAVDLLLKHVENAQKLSNIQT